MVWIISRKILAAVRVSRYLYRYLRPKTALELDVEVDAAALHLVGRMSDDLHALLVRLLMAHPISAKRM